MIKIQNVLVHTHKVLIGGTEENFNLWTSHIKNKLIAHLTNAQEQLCIDVYNLDGKPRNLHAGNDNRLVIIGHTTFSNKEFVSHEFEYKGKVVAEYSEEENELYINTNIFATYDDESKDMFTHIIEQLNEYVFKKKTLLTSWLHSEKKEELKEELVSGMKLQLESELRQNLNTMNEVEETITQLKRRMKSEYDRLNRLRRSIKAERENINVGSERLTNDLDLIVQNDKILDLHIKDGKFYVFTDEIYAYDEDDQRYHIGKFEIEINLDDADIRFKGNNPRRSFWTAEDPHPHINGENGRACLGNVDSTIAELASKNELYALALTCIDFLEAVNTSDPAGENIHHWDLVDEDGSVIREGSEDTYGKELCPACEEYVNEDDMYTVYDSVDEDGEPDDDVCVCYDCRANNYTYYEHLGAYVNDSVTIEEEDDEF